MFIFILTNTKNTTHIIPQLIMSLISDNFVLPSTDKFTDRKKKLRCELNTCKMCNDPKCATYPSHHYSVDLIFDGNMYKVDKRECLERYIKHNKDVMTLYVINFDFTTLENQQLFSKLDFSKFFTIHIENCKLNHIPENICSQTRELYIEDTTITDELLSNTTPPICILRKLSLNNIKGSINTKSLNTFLRHITAPSYFDVSVTNCNLTSDVPFYIVPGTGLINYSYNHLVKFKIENESALEFDQIPKHFNLSHNNIKRIPIVFTVLNININIVNLAFNYISHLFISSIIAINLRKLDLSYNYINEVCMPHKRRKLEWLILNNNSITTVTFGMKHNHRLFDVLDTRIYECTTPYILYLDNNNIKSIRVPAHMVFSTLSVNDNLLKSLLIDGVVKHLFCNNNILKNIHYNQQHTTEIESIDISNNRFRTIPSWIQTLPSDRFIHTIDVSGNLIMSVKLQCIIHRLDLSDNPLKSVDIKTAGIHTLIMNDCGLINLPVIRAGDTINTIHANNNPDLRLYDDTFAALTGLSELDLSCCKLKQIPCLPDTINELRLDHNLLTDLPQMPTNLQFLYLSHNRFAAIPLHLAHIPIYELDVSHNALKATDVGVNYLTSISLTNINNSDRRRVLEKLVLSDNTALAIHASEFLPWFHRLHTLNISNTAIDLDFYKAFYRWPSTLRHLNISSIIVLHDPLMNTSIPVVNPLFYSKLETLICNHSDVLPNILHHIITNSDPLNTTFTMYYTLERLQADNCVVLYERAHAPLSHPDALDGISSFMVLHTLSLKNNKIQVIPESLGMMANLNHLTLSDNSICALPSSFAMMKKVDVLDLANNDFITVPEVIQFMHLYGSLILSGNPIQHFDPCSLPFSLCAFTLVLDKPDERLLDITLNDFSRVTTLTKLTLTGNIQYRCAEDSPYCDMLPFLHTLSLVDCKIQAGYSVPKGVVQLHCLRTDLSHLLNYGFIPIPYYHRFETVELNTCTLTSIPDPLKNACTLRHLTVSYNEITDIGNLSSLCLRTLDASNNPLAHLSEDLFAVHCASICSLDISHTGIEALPTTLYNAYLRHLNISATHCLDPFFAVEDQPYIFRDCALSTLYCDHLTLSTSFFPLHLVLTIRTAWMRFLSVVPDTISYDAYTPDYPLSGKSIAVYMENSTVSHLPTIWSYLPIRTIVLDYNMRLTALTVHYDGSIRSSESSIRMRAVKERFIKTIQYTFTDAYVAAEAKRERRSQELLSDELLETFDCTSPVPTNLVHSPPAIKRCSDTTQLTSQEKRSYMYKTETQSPYLNDTDYTSDTFLQDPIYFEHRGNRIHLPERDALLFYESGYCSHPIIMICTSYNDYKMGGVAPQLLSKYLRQLTLIEYVEIVTTPDSPHYINSLYTNTVGINTFMFLPFHSLRSLSFDLSNMDVIEELEILRFFKSPQPINHTLSLNILCDKLSKCDVHDNM